MSNSKILREEEQQKELYIATLVHDLKTPLQAQLSSLNLLRNGKFGPVTEQQQKLLDIIIESAIFMQDMLHNVLDTYKIENGVVKIKPEETNLDELIKICINEIANFAMTYDIEIEYINTVKEPKISADKKLIRRVLANMLNNGINYSYKNTKLTINLYEKDNKTFIKIKNTGYEIPEEIKEHIFDKYVSSGQLNHKTGAGLGLYYCKKVIEAHNGNISLIAENNCNEFIIEFPKAPKDNSDKPFTFV